MGRPRVYPDELRVRAVRLVYEWRKEPQSTIRTVATKHRPDRPVFYRAGEGNRNPVFSLGS